MLTVSDLALQYGKRILFDEVNLKFTLGNCYGVIGANGAGKSTFLKILSREIDPNRGTVSLAPGNRMAVLKQNHFEFEEVSVIETVIMGHAKMYSLMVEKNAIYMNPDATEAEGMKAAELENEFGEMGGWTADSDAAELLSHLGVREHLHGKQMKDLGGSDKVKVLLAQALFGSPDILLLDEPTNDLDAETVTWLADFLAEYKSTVIVVSHDRYFLDMVCTHVVDIDFSKIRIYSGNYTFWYETSQLMARQMANKNKKTEHKRQELMEFIQRFSANASKSKQATSRKKALEKLNIDEIRPSSRKYPYINFSPERAPGGQILTVKDLKKTGNDGDLLFNKVSFTFNKGEKIALISRTPGAVTAFYEVLSGNIPADSGTIEYGQTITMAHLPNENESFFKAEEDIDLINWLRQYCDNDEEKDEQFIRGFLGRMLFSGEEVLKKASVLSGGEKVRCMLAKIMQTNPNFLLLDEPTNHLDLESITVMNKALQDFTGNLIVSSHDHELMNSVCNRVLEISPNGIIDRLTTFDEYIRSDEMREKREALYGVIA